MPDGIEFKATKEIPVEQLLQLFLKEQWNDYMTLDDVRFHVDHALEVVSAWHGATLVGYARLEGDGRLSVEISDVLVASEYQGKGIGTQLVRRLVESIRALDPYDIQVAPVGDREVHLYGKLGFTEIPDYRRMELLTEKLDRRIRQVRNQTPGGAAADQR